MVGVNCQPKCLHSLLLAGLGFLVCFCSTHTLNTDHQYKRVEVPAQLLGGNSETLLLKEMMYKLSLNLKVIMEVAEHRREREQSQCLV